jgi:hypothetical protein
VLNYSVHSVIDDACIPSSRLSSFEPYGKKSLLLRKTDFLDEVPVMPATVFGLDMLLQEPNIDLQMASELVLSDVGATIQTLRFVGKEYESAAERPTRMCECIAGLDTALWFETISSQIFVGDREHPATTAIWKHCRSVAQCARFVAQSMDDVLPDDAYMVGLLHGIGAIPAALDWSEGQLCSAMSAMEDTLPPFVLAAIKDVDDPSCASVWRFVLTAAHRLAAAEMHPQRPISCDMSSMAIRSL